MKAVDLYEKLEKDFVTVQITENWYEDTENFSVFDEYVCAGFKECSLGLLCDFAHDVYKVYTAVFPSDKVLKRIISDNITDAMLFVHHPLVWEINDTGRAFHPINPELLEVLRERRISLFNYHLPLDNYSEYATTKTLADVLGIKIVKPYNNYCGAVCGIIGITDCKTVQELNAKYAKVVGHETKLYEYGDAVIKDGKVSLCAGGGNDLDVARDLIAEGGINVHITGISQNNIYSAESHKLEHERRINLLGGTHYSSEKFACIAVCDYFINLGLEAEFIHDKPCLLDL